MALLRAPAALLALLAGVLLVAGCGGSSPAAAVPTTLDGLAASAQRSANASTGRFSFALTMSIPPIADGLGFTGEGAFDAAVDKTEMTLDLSSFVKLMEGIGGASGGLDADDFRMSAVLDGVVMYLRFPFLADKLPSGKPWVRIDLQQAAANVPGVDLEQMLQLANNGPHATLDYLRAVSGEIETVGADMQRGVATTHYRTTVDLAKYARLVPEAQRELIGSVLDRRSRWTSGSARTASCGASR
jgi:hypothetical protein